MTRSEKDSEALFEAIRTRRSISLNSLDPEPIDRALIERMLEAANWAPTHKKTEPWRFVVYDGEHRQALSDAFSEAYRQIATGDDFSEAKFQVLRDKVWQVHNAQLMACSMGLGCKWTSGATSIHPHVAEVAGFAPDIRLLGFLYVGRPTGSWPEGQRRPSSAKIRWDGNPEYGRDRDDT